MVLTYLQKHHEPVSREEILRELGISGSQLDFALSHLNDAGYDIKTIYHESGRDYSLVRYAKHTQGQYFRILGHIETPFVISSDQHIGSNYFTEQGFDQLVEFVEQNSIRDVVMPGDVLQGRGVHRMEAEDVDKRFWRITDQIEEGIRQLNKFPEGTRIHVVMGTHEEKILGSIEVGLDVFKAMAPRVKGFRYYGHIAKLSVDEDYTALMLHTSGGMPYAISYKAQRLWETLIERPNILITGHLHQLWAIPRPRFNLLTMGGTLQRENSYLISKGIVAQVGWLCIWKFGNGRMDVEFVVPEVY